MKIILVAGARPNFMKIAPIIRALKHRKNNALVWKLVHTGQHYDHTMSQTFFDDLGIPEPDYFFEAGSGTHAEQTSKIMVAFEELCEKEMPDVVLVVGDVNSTLACSIVAKKHAIKFIKIDRYLYRTYFNIRYCQYLRQFAFWSVFTKNYFLNINKINTL